MKNLKLAVVYICINQKFYDYIKDKLFIELIINYILTNKIKMYLPPGAHREHRILDVITLDKGKKHFWGDIKGDYGFLQSSDRNQLRRLKQTRYKFGHNRSMTTQMNPQDNSYEEGYTLYHDLNNNSSLPLPDQKNKKKNLQISNHIQIHLPAIQTKRNSMSIQQANPKSNSMALYDTSARTDLENYNTVKLQQRTIDHGVSHKKVKWEDQEQTYRNQRAKTETSDYEELSARKKRIRYTPTFICSLGNPMPSYKLYKDQKRPYPYPLLAHK